MKNAPKNAPKTSGMSFDEWYFAACKLAGVPQDKRGGSIVEDRDAAGVGDEYAAKEAWRAGQTCTKWVEERKKLLTKEYAERIALAAELRVKQLVVAPFGTDGNRTYSTLALGEDGCVYRYDPHCEGWIRWSMKIATCRDQHKAKR